MESFGAAFPKVFADPGFKGWFVSVILLGEFPVEMFLEHDAKPKKLPGLVRL